MKHYVATAEELKAYKEHPGLNQSRAKILVGRGGVHAFKEYGTEQEADLYYSEKEHFIIGQAADVRVCYGDERFFEQFYVSQVEKKPTGKGFSILHWVYDMVIAGTDAVPELTTTKFSDHKLLIYEACNNHDYYIGRMKEDWEEDTRWKTLVTEDLELYWRDLMNAFGKQVLSREQYETVKLITASWMTHPHTSQYFTSTDIINIYQFPVYFTFEGVDCKGLLDKVEIYPEARIIRINDLKVIGERTSGFLRKMRQFRWDFQNAWYFTGMMKDETARRRITQMTGVDVSEFTIDLPGWFVESSKFPGQSPRIFGMTWNLYNEALDGTKDRFVTDSHGKQLFVSPARKGIKDALDRFKYHEKHGYEDDMEMMMGDNYANVEWNRILTPLSSRG